MKLFNLFCFSTCSRRSILAMFFIGIFITVTPYSVAENSWQGGDMSGVASTVIYEAGNWSEGVPTKENPGRITNVNITTSGSFKPIPTGGNSIALTLDGTTTLTQGGRFAAFENHATTGYLSLTLKENAQMTANGNFWVGTGDGSVPSPISGEDYAAYLTFSDNSTLTATGEAWLALSAKTKIRIEGNASVTSQSGNSGIGCAPNAAGSLLEMTGGSLNAVNFYVSQADYQTTMNQSGGNVAVSGNFYVGNEKRSTNPKYNLSGAGGLNVENTFYNYGVTTVGGNATLTTPSFYDRGDFTLSGDASVNVTGKVRFSDIADKGATYTQTGGTFTYSGTNGDGFLVSRYAGSSIEMNLSGGEFNITSASNSDFIIADNATASANINVSGTAVLNTKGVKLGNAGTATLNMSGNSSWTSSSGTFFVGAANHFSGVSVNMSEDAYLKVNEMRDYGSFTVGGSATFEATNFYLQNELTLKENGKINVTSKIRFSEEADRTDTYTQTGGTFTYSGTTGDGFLVSRYANTNMLMNISGGQFNITAANSNDLVLSDNATATTTMNISGTAALSTKNVYVGRRGTATINMSGDSTWTTNGSNFYMGYENADAEGTLNMSGNAQLTTNLFRMAYSAAGGDNAGGKATVTMTDNAKLTVNGDFYPFRGNKSNSHPGTGYANLVVDGNAELKIATNFWSGSDNATNVTSPFAGEEYAAYYTFGGNSKTTIGEFWAGMTAKTHTIVKDNATITVNSKLGIGWTEAVNDSLMEVQGGTINANNVVVSEGAGNSATLNQTGGIINTPTFTVGQVGGTVNLTGGDLYTTSLTNNGTFNVAKGGRIQVGSLGATTGETLTINAGATPIEMNGDFVLDVFTLTDFDKINVANGAMNFGDNVGVILNIANPDGFNDTEAYIIGNSWASGFSDDAVQAVSVAVTGVDGFIASIQSDGSILFGNANALPEPATWVLLCLGAVALFWQKQRK